MTPEELNKLLSANKETEHLEFKEAKVQFSILGAEGKEKKSLYGYCVAIGNEGGGKIIFGVKDSINQETGKRDIVGTNALPDLQKAKEQIYKVLGRRIEIEEITTENGKVQVVVVPSHPLAEPFKFFGVHLMRSGEKLEEMDAGTLTKIINENRPDFSALINEGANFDDLDEKAMEILKSKWIEKSRNNDLKKCTQWEILEKLLLVKAGKINNACLLLVGKEASLGRLIPNSEVFLEWRLVGGKMEYDQRKIIRKPYLIADEDIWNFVDSRNTRVPFKKGFFEMDIWAYDEQSVREAMLNAFAHREYHNRTEPIYVRVSPEKISVKSAGGFVPGVTEENIFEVEGKWRNPLLMDVLGKIGLVERAGFGLDRIYKTTISQGKGMPDFKGTSDEYVILNIPAQVRDFNFVYFLQKIEKEKQLNIDTTKDFIELETIRTVGKINDGEKIKLFFKNGIIEKTGVGRGMRYVLSKDFYEFIDKRGEHIRKKWLNKDEQKKIIFNYLKTYKNGKVSDFKQLFKERELSNQQLNKLLKELASEGVYFDGKQRSPKAFWKIKGLVK